MFCAASTQLKKPHFFVDQLFPHIQQNYINNFETTVAYVPKEPCVRRRDILLDCTLRSAQSKLRIGHKVCYQSINRKWRLSHLFLSFQSKFRTPSSHRSFLLGLDCICRQDLILAHALAIQDMPAWPCSPHIKHVTESQLLHRASGNAFMCLNCIWRCDSLTATRNRDVY